MSRRIIAGALARLQRRSGARKVRDHQRPQSVRLDDGTAIVVRPVREEDKDRLAALTDSLSDESRSRRYLAPKGPLTEAELEYFTEIDHRDHEALVALDGPAGNAIGVARYIRHPMDARSAEAAVVVSDRWQRRGIARALLGRLAALARANGVRHFTAVLLSHNTASLHLLKQLGDPRATHDGGGTVAVNVELPRARRTRARR
jgi:RimJ/RimL family protein N-acetyltransferase